LSKTRSGPPGDCWQDAPDQYDHSVLAIDVYNRKAVIITQSDFATLSACLENVGTMTFFQLCDKTDDMRRSEVLSRDDPDALLQLSPMTDDRCPLQGNFRSLSSPRATLLRLRPGGSIHQGLS